MARTVVLIYGILVLLGGVAGYQISGSTASLAAGGGVGTALLVCYALAAKKPAIKKPAAKKPAAKKSSAPTS